MQQKMASATKNGFGIPKPLNLNIQREIVFLR